MLQDRASKTVSADSGERRLNASARGRIKAGTYAETLTLCGWTLSTLTTQRPALRALTSIRSTILLFWQRGKVSGIF